MTENMAAREIVDAAFRVRRGLGPGLFETVYVAVLLGELQKRGLVVVGQHPIPAIYEGRRFEMGFRADLVVEDKVIVEIKSVADIAAVQNRF